MAVSGRPLPNLDLAAIGHWPYLSVDDRQMMRQNQGHPHSGPIRLAQIRTLRSFPI